MSSAVVQPNHEKDVIFQGQQQGRRRSPATQVFYDSVLASVLSAPRGTPLPTIVQECLYQWVVVHRVLFWNVDKSQQHYTRVHPLEDRLPPPSTDLVRTPGGMTPAGGADTPADGTLLVVDRMVRWLNRRQQKLFLDAACSTTESSVGSSDSNCTTDSDAKRSAGIKPDESTEKRRRICHNKCSCHSVIRVDNHDTTTHPTSCGTCSNCTKTRCGACFHCESSDPKAECLQKMCLHRSELRSAPGLPEGWTYVFTYASHDRTLGSFRGLRIVAKNGRTYYTAERALNGRTAATPATLEKDVFYKHVGLSGVIDPKYPYIRADARFTNGCYTTSSLTSCGACSNCTKARCGTCFHCESSDPSAECLQKMCLHRSELRSAPGLPEGWTYAFTYASQDRTLDSFRGLRIVAKNGRTYYNVERALNGRAAKPATLKKDVFYKHVGLSGVVDPKYPHMSSDASGTIGIDSSNLQVGSRCYAQFTNGYYYWGEIANVNNTGAQRTYDVQFDDGDFLADIHEFCVETEETAFLGGVSVPNLLGQEQRSQFLGLLDLHAQRCKTCTLCRRLDCGRCHSCRINADSSTSRRFACIRKMCLQIDQEQKSQTIPGLPRIWRFYFTDIVPNVSDHHTTHLTKLHPESLLHVTVGNRSFNCLEEALEVLGYSKDVVMKTVRDFYESHLGILLRHSHDHELVNQPYFTEWIDCNGQRREIYGMISACWKDLYKSHDNLTFTVQYDGTMRNWARRMATTKLQIPESRDLSEELAWCGHLAWRKVGLTNIDDRVRPPSFHMRWIAPGVRFKEFDRGAALPHITMVVGGFQLCLFAKSSGIPQAGRGLFVRIAKQQFGPSQSSSVFELPAGHLVDLGVYAPSTNEECKSEQVVVMKNFLMQDFAESYSFAKAVCDKNDFDLFDVTQDDRPALTKSAAENLLVFANESDGKTEVPSLVCRYDAEGAIHYLMGHDDADYGPLVIPVDQDFELKIDYGTLYEKVRVRKGYSRFTGSAKQNLIDACRNDDAETMSDIVHWNVASVDSCLRILENLLREDAVQPPIDDFLERTLTIALALRARVLSIEHEFLDVDFSQTDEYCDNGVSSMADKGVADRSVRVIQRACTRCSAHEDGLLSVILAHKLLKVQLMECLNLSEDVLHCSVDNEIRGMIFLF